MDYKLFVEVVSVGRNDMCSGLASLELGRAPDVAVTSLHIRSGEPQGERR